MCLSIKSCDCRRLFSVVYWYHHRRSISVLQIHISPVGEQVTVSRVFLASGIRTSALEVSFTDAFVQ